MLLEKMEWTYYDTQNHGSFHDENGHFSVPEVDVPKMFLQTDPIILTKIVFNHRQAIWEWWTQHL